MKIKNKILPSITVLFLILSAILFSTFIYYDFYYGEVDPEQLFYTLMEAKSTSPEVISAILIIVGIPALFFGIVFLYIYFSSKNGFSYKSKRISTNHKRVKVIAFVLSIVLLLTNIGFLLKTIGIDEFIKYQTSSGTFIEENYVNPKTTKINFPEKKKNLILLFSESMENSYASIEDGGVMQESLIPELVQLSNNNISFSHTDKLGGARETYGTTWTTAGITAHTFGLPLKINGNLYGVGTSYLPGAYSLFEILKDNGYNLLTAKGSDIEFGGLASMMKDHGDIKHFDYYSAIEEGKIPSTYHEFWGYEDAKLFEYMKEKLTDMSNQEEPFMLMMETVDTHFPNGYICKNCENTYPVMYSNVIRCQSKMINNFIEWCKTQDWYEDTVIVITGDHLTMKSDYFPNLGNYERTTYNCFINSSINSENTKNRMFSEMDMFPTILAAMGCEIEGDRLGLGTNLFSKNQTLYEKYGYDFVNEELKKKSNFYTDTLM